MSGPDLARVVLASHAGGPLAWIDEATFWSLKAAGVHVWARTVATAREVSP